MFIKRYHHCRLLISLGDAVNSFRSRISRRGNVYINTC
jgi:hypothetical protein